MVMQHMKYSGLKSQKSIIYAAKKAIEQSKAVGPRSVIRRPTASGSLHKSSCCVENKHLVLADVLLPVLHGEQVFIKQVCKEWVPWGIVQEAWYRGERGWNYSTNSFKSC